MEVNKAERQIGGTMSKANKARFLKSVFAGWVQRILRYIPDVPGPLAVFDFIPGWMYDGSLLRQGEWERKHPGQKYYEGAGGC